MTTRSGHKGAATPKHPVVRAILADADVLDAVNYALCGTLADAVAEALRSDAVTSALWDAAGELAPAARGVLKEVLNDVLDNARGDGALTKALEAYGV